MPDTTLQVIAQALLDSDVDQGHATPDTPQWGRYEVLAGAALEALKNCPPVFGDISKRKGSLVNMYMEDKAAWSEAIDRLLGESSSDRS